jgi:CrcB protein
MIYIWVGLAGIVGAVLRFMVGILTKDWAGSFPLGTLLINCLGAFVLAWLTTRSPFSTEVRTALGTGMIGSFTTFSTLSVETVQLFVRGDAGLALLYLLISLWGGLLFAWLGNMAARPIRRIRGDEV